MPVMKPVRHGCGTSNEMPVLSTSLAKEIVIAFQFLKILSGNSHL